MARLVLGVGAHHLLHVGVLGVREQHVEGALVALLGVRHEREQERAAARPRHQPRQEQGLQHDGLLLLTML